MNKVEHEIHNRRFSRNVGTAVALLLLVLIIGGLTMVKLSNLPPPELPEDTSQ